MQDICTDPMVYLQKFIGSYVRVTMNLGFCRSSVTRPAQLEALKQVPVILDGSPQAIHIDADPKVAIPISAIESVTMPTVSAGSMGYPYISIAVQGERSPYILFTPSVEALDLWYDGIRLNRDLRPERPSSLKKGAVITKAVEQAIKGRAKDAAVVIPPPPPLPFPPAPPLFDE